jgi:hypothetical protein
MILAISSNKSFIKICFDVAEKLGYLFISADYENAIDIALFSKSDTIIVHSDKETETFAKECVSLLALRIPELKILAAVEKSPDSPSRYLDIEGSHRQINLPASPLDIANAITKLTCACPSFNALVFGGERKALTLLGERLRLSKTDYAILRLTAKAYPSPLDENRLHALYPKMTKNALAVHISVINKAAARITERRLIVFKSGYRLNEFM